MRRLLLLPACLLLLGCDHTTQPRTSPTTIADSVATRTPKPWADFETKLIPLSDKEILMGKHSHPGSGKTAKLYLSPAAKEVLKKLISNPRTWPGEFRTGSLIVQEQEDGTLYIMRKRPLGRLPNSKDWFFALERDDRTILQSGVNDDRVKEACIDCHSTKGAKTDWIIVPRQ